MKEIQFIAKQEKISLVAPSFGCATEPYKTRLKVAIKNLKKDGFIIEEGPNIFLANHKVRSNTAELCGKEFNDAYFNSDSKLIISVGGGEIMCEILPFIDFEKIKNYPAKLFMGFSDNTNLTYTLTTICDIYTIYGPCAGYFAFKPYKTSTLDAFKLIQGKQNVIKGYPTWRYGFDQSDDPLYRFPHNRKKVLKYNKKKEIDVNGRLLGGCLDCLITICGTKYDKTKDYIEKYKDDGIIWFIEACDLNVISIQRALFQLKQSGWFKYAKLFIFGRPLCFGNKMFDVSVYDAIKEELNELNVPIIMDADLGHFDPSMPMVTGAYANVKVDKKNIIINYDFSKNN